MLAFRHDSFVKYSYFTESIWQHLPTQETGRGILLQLLQSKRGNCVTCYCFTSGKLITF